MNERPSMQAIYDDASQAAWLGLAVNLLLGITKLLAGMIGHSLAMLSDAVNSLGDVLTSIVVVVALRIAQRPPDKNHPYGHTRAEGIAASNVALLIVISAVLMGVETLRQMGEARPLPAAWTLWIAASNVVIKEALYHYKMRVGLRTGSVALIANAWDHRSDALCALAVFIGLSVVLLAGPAYLFVDGLAAFVVLGAIIGAGASLFRKSASALMDAQADASLIEKVRETASATEGVEAVEKVLVRKTGLEHLADIHVQVAPALSVAEGHRISHLAKDDLLAAIPSLRDVLVHLEPFEGDRPPT